MITYSKNAKGTKGSLRVYNSNLQTTFRTPVLGTADIQTLQQSLTTNQTFIKKTLTIVGKKTKYCIKVLEPNTFNTIGVTRNEFEIGLCEQHYDNFLLEKDALSVLV
jgi:hypothetical protein